MVRDGSEEWRRGLWERRKKDCWVQFWGVGKAVVSDKGSGPVRLVSTLIHCGSLGELGNPSKPQFTDLGNGGDGLRASGLQTKLRDGGKARWL